MSPCGDRGDNYLLVEDKIPNSGSRTLDMSVEDVKYSSALYIVRFVLDEY